MLFSSAIGWPDYSINLTMMDYNYVWVASLGLFLALSELLSRYRNVRLIFQSGSAWTYMLINGFTSCISYYFIYHNKLTFGDFTKTEVGTVLFAGFSAMFVLRSSFFSYYDKDSGKTVSIGLAAILEIFLDTAERSFDQEQSVCILKVVKNIMKDVDFAKASLDLTATCLNLMQNVSTDEQKQLSESLKSVSEKGITSNETKSLNLGILLSRITGVTLLAQAVESCFETIKISSKDQAIFSNLDALKGKL